MIFLFVTSGVINLLSVCGCFCAFKREGLVCVRVCGYFSSRVVLVVVQNEIHGFIEAIVGLRGGQTEGGDRPIGGDSARRAFISSETQKKRACVCVSLSVCRCASCASGKFKSKFEAGGTLAQCQ